MDHVPYEFIDRVFTATTYQTIGDLHEQDEQAFNSTLWNEIINVYKNNTQPMQLTVVSTPDGLKYGLFNYRDSSNPIACTINELLQMDPRFKRIVRFDATESFRSLDPDHLQKLLITRLPALIKCVSRHILHTVSINLADDLHRRPIMAEFLKYGLDLQLEFLELSYSTESADFLRNHLQQQSLRCLDLHGVWPSAPKEDLMAFICRPQFVSFQSPQEQFLEIEDVAKIVAYSKTLEARWCNFSIFLQTKRTNLNDLSSHFALWMPQNGLDEDVDSFEEHEGNVVVSVRCNMNHCAIRFSTFGI